MAGNDKEFHRMLGILIDYDDRIHKICDSSEVEVRKQKLTEMASTEGISLEEQDINDLVSVLENIRKIKSEKESCYLRSPRN
jgi:predicted adenine nucleotide alpha hydrolase (AANH) superfamily ATPase